MEKHFTQSVRSVPQKKIGGPLFLFTGEHNFINKEREVQHKVSPAEQTCILHLMLVQLNIS